MSEIKSILVKERIPFTQIPNGIINDKNLSSLAFKIYCYMMSKPENWKFYNKNIIENMKEGRDSCLKAIKELENSGWIKSTIINNKSGTYKEYYIYIKPENQGTPPTENQGTPPTENQGTPPTENQGTPPTENQGTEKYLENNTKNNTKNNTENICGDKSPRGSATEKEKKAIAAFAVYEAYQIFYYKITGKYTKLKFLTDTKRACMNIVNEYKESKSLISLGEFAYKVFVGNYLRLESMGTDHKLRITTAGNYVGSNIEYMDENDIQYDFENAKKLYKDYMKTFASKEIKNLSFLKEK